MSRKHSHDVYPQYFVTQLSTTTNDTTIVAAIPLPVPRIPTSGKATILEFLWADINMETGRVGNSSNFTALSLTGSSTLTAGSGGYHTFLANPQVIGYHKNETDQITGVGVQLVDQPYRLDWQSNDGKGLLIATDRIYIYVTSLATLGLVRATWRVWYRYVDVSIQEYVGIVQSQQA